MTKPMAFHVMPDHRAVVHRDVHWRRRLLDSGEEICALVHPWLIRRDGVAVSRVAVATTALGPLHPHRSRTLQILDGSLHRDRLHVSLPQLVLEVLHGALRWEGHGMDHCRYQARENCEPERQAGRW